MKLGAFSLSLAVKDIRASKDFYEKLGFEEIGGNLEQNWLILRNEQAILGLFQGMFEQNVLTFNPGWTHLQETLEQFDDVREIQAALKASGLQLVSEAEPDGTEPASFTLLDPDGNPILVDQHVPKP